jgi:hypothetical protein
MFYGTVAITPFFNLFYSYPLHLLIVSAQGCGFTWSHSWTHTQSVGLPWTRAGPVAETSTRTGHIHTRQRLCLPGGIRTRNPSKRVAADSRGHPFNFSIRGKTNAKSKICLKAFYSLSGKSSCIRHLKVLLHEYWNHFAKNGTHTHYVYKHSLTHTHNSFALQAFDVSFKEFEI